MEEEQKQSTRNIHRHLSRMTKMILGASIAVFVGVLVIGAVILLWPDEDDAVKPGTAKASSTVQEVEEKSPEQLGKEYRESVVEILSGLQLENTTDVEGRLSRVLALRVPADLKGVHLELVSALSDAQMGEVQQAQDRLNTLKSQHAWMTF